MSFLQKNIRYLRKKNEWSQEYIAKRLGYKSYTTIQKWEMGTSEPPLKKTRELADLFNVDIDDLANKDLELPDESNNNLERKINNIYPIELKCFPLLGEIACGIPTYTNENRESYVLSGTDINADFCLKAKGDSMINARIYDGDIVFIRKQDIVDNGEIAAVVVNSDSEATLKRLYYYKERATLILKAENPIYEDLIFQNEELNDVHILGKAVAFQSDVK